MGVKGTTWYDWSNIVALTTFGCFPRATAPLSAGSRVSLRLLARQIKRNSTATATIRTRAAMPLAISAFISPNRRSSPNGLLGTVQEFRGGEKITNHSQILFSGWFCVLHLQEMYNLVWLWTTAKSRAVRSTEVNGNPMRLNINLTPYSCLLNLPWIIKLTRRMICVNYSPYLVWPSMVVLPRMAKYYFTSHLHDT